MSFRYVRLAAASIIILLISAVATSAKDKKKNRRSLPERYSALSCAVVQITFNAGAGTGFFIDQQGDLVTAAHVALKKTFFRKGDQIMLTAEYLPGLSFTRNGQPPVPLSLPPLTDADNIRAFSDLAILRTGVKQSCFLTAKVSGSESVGEHVIAIGYPVSAPTGALYDGLVSARYKHLPQPIAVVDNIPIFPNYDVIRIQMPITPGASGSPVLDDNDEVIGVVSENPTVWFGDLNNLIQYGQQVNGGFNAPVSDLPKMLAKLAWIVQDFESSGAGLAVPVSYLQVPEQKAAPPASQK